MHDSHAIVQVDLIERFARADVDARLSLFLNELGLLAFIRHEHGLDLG
ncbi:MAG TPA: hypothetical protein H9902_14155 [Candidatus Stackebrandtia faecavium]|nr:hypothetical protein [Candidatus Stackebrandtia faecavium]